ncbi:MAG: glycoside hydrolase family 9 protein [Terracidiphilus sp.]|jgi:endoglucanase
MNRRKFLRTAGACLAALKLARYASGFERVASMDAASDAVAGAGGIRLNQIGYLPGRPKVASVSVLARSFRVRSLATNAVVFEAGLSAPHADPASGDTIRRADFSSLRTPGQYRIELDTGAQGDPFCVGRDVYAQAVELTMRSFYGQRCGCEVNLDAQHAHAKCHMESAFHPSSGKTGASTNYGGWHDAGDYGRYIVNSGITTATLLWAWEMFPSLHTMSLRIPESGGPIPDFLAEIQWNLKWMMSLQDTDGGVWHKQTRNDFCGFILPQDEQGPNYIIGTGADPFKGTGATADFAAVMAIAARCYRSAAPEFATSCLQAARRAWAWLQAHPNVRFNNPADIHTAEYGDAEFHDEILWAAGELWRTTGEEAFHRAFLAILPHSLNDLTIDVPTATSVSALGYWTYVLAQSTGSEEAKAAIRQATLKKAEPLARQCAENGYGNSLAIEDYQGASNATATNHALLLLVADRFHPNAVWTNCALDSIHYLLGRNCFGISWVTQLGTHSVLQPHHRPSAAIKDVPPWPGLLVVGPNASPSDPISLALGKRPPMRMYVDDHLAYSCNEPIITCNAPLVFALASTLSQR